MLSAFVFLNCDVWTKPAIVSQISDMSSFSEAVRVSGAYNIVAKLSKESREEEDIANLVKKIPATAKIRSSLTMIVSEEEHAVKQMER
jgi:hypothetical protein